VITASIKNERICLEGKEVNRQLGRKIGKWFARPQPKYQKSQVTFWCPPRLLPWKLRVIQKDLHYLGLAEHPEWFDSQEKAARLWGASWHTLKTPRCKAP